MRINIHNAEFVKTAAAPSGFISDGLPQIVFAGKSNVGKSSVINRLLARKNLARTGASPGKTTNVNYFIIDGAVYLVDLPGYGYAKVAKAERHRWGRLMEAFFSAPEVITLGVMIVDARHAPTVDDITMARLFVSTGRPFIVLANKVDKVKPSAIDGSTALIRRTLELSDQTRVLPFSAEKGTNRDLLIEMIAKELES